MNESMTPNMYIKSDYSAQIEEWLAQGNQIKSLDRGASTHNMKFNNKPKNAQSAMKAVMAKSVKSHKAKRARQDEDKAGRADIAELATWLDAKKCRAKQLCLEVGISDGFLSQIKRAWRPCSKAWMLKIKQGMKVVEAKESVTSRDGEG